VPIGAIYLGKTMKTKEIIAWLEKWNPHNQHVTLSTIFAKMGFSRGKTHVINHGPPGTGKSHSTIELIKRLNLGTEIMVDNTTTDRGLFELFLNYPEQDIVLDECSTLLRSKKTQDMVKMSQEGKPLSWMKMDSTETTEPYKGNLIINANVPIEGAVIDRCLFNKTGMNREMALSFNEYYIEEYQNPTDFAPFIDFLRKVVKVKTEPKLTKDEVQKIYLLVKENIQGTDQLNGFSRRTLIRELNYFKHMKRLFGKLDDEVFEYAKPFAETYIINAHTPGLIESIVGDTEIEKANLVKRVAAEGRYTETHARRLVNAAIRDGKIKLWGKVVRKA